MSAPDDVVLTLTLSGKTTELSEMIAFCCHFGAKLIVVTSHCDSTAGLAADICLTLPQIREACPNQLAPSSSTTAQMVLGNVIAVTLIEKRGFSKSDFLRLHRAACSARS